MKCANCGNDEKPVRVHGGRKEPRDGDYFICLRCSDVSVVEDGARRSLSADDISGMPPALKAALAKSLLEVLCHAVGEPDAEDELPDIPQVLLDRRDHSVLEFERRYVKRGDECEKAVVLRFLFEEGRVTDVEVPDIPNGPEGGVMVDRMTKEVENQDSRFNGMFFMAEGWATPIKRNMDRKEALVTKVYLRGHRTETLLLEIDREKRELQPLRWAAFAEEA